MHIIKYVYKFTFTGKVQIWGKLPLGYVHGKTKPLNIYKKCSKHRAKIYWNTSFLNGIPLFPVEKSWLCARIQIQ